MENEIKELESTAVREHLGTEEKPWCRT